MYKLLLSWRYLRTRWIALASIISVMLGVATMIVVNSVMAGFTHEMQDRLHSILSDVVFESRGIDGFQDVDWHMEQIRKIAGDEIAAMTPTVVVPGMLQMQIRGEWVPRPVNVIGIDESTHMDVNAFSDYLQHPENRKTPSFELRDDGYDVFDHQVGAEALRRDAMETAGWTHRRRWAEREKNMQPPAPDPAEARPDAPVDPFATQQAAENIFDPTRQQHTGVILGMALASYRAANGRDYFLALPGNDVKVTLPTAGTPPKAVSDSFTVVDLYECKMSEYDASLVFVPLRHLQELRGMIDPSTGQGSVTSIQMRLKDPAQADRVRDKLRAFFPPEVYNIATWRDKQGALLAAVQLETAILNVLLFMIIAVAGFGILAIFYMIVVEKTRDIGILKSLGASGRGILGIFLAYGLSLGIVGSGVGLIIGLLFVVYINQIADVLGWLTGREVFNPAIYYFQEIPTIIEPLTVAWIVAGALFIAVMASVLPARRAARLHPVEALRYE